MTKSAMIRARMDEKLKIKVERIFKKLGMSTTNAITLFYTQILLNNGLPFDVKIPNQTTQKTFRDTDKNKNLDKAQNVKQLFTELEI